jgi:hypothetical protein
MTEGSGRHAGEEGDFFDRWLAQRDREAGAGGGRRSSTNPPTWAPKASVPSPEPVAEPELLADLPAEPVVETPVVEAPVVEAPAAEAPVVEAPVVEAPVVEAPVVESAVLATAPAPRSAPEALAEVPVRATTPAAPVAPTVAVPTVAAEHVDDDPLDETPEPEHEPEPTSSEPAGSAAPAPIRHTFRPRTRARTAVGIGALLAASASVLGVYVASREQDAPSIGIAATLWVLTAIIWAVHSGTSVTRLSVRGGQLQVVRQGVRTTIDLTSSYTPVEVHGKPGKHGWKVVFRRRDGSSFVVDHSMVEPGEFMRVLRYYRPGLDTEPAAAK